MTKWCEKIIELVYLWWKDLMSLLNILPSDQCYKWNKIRQHEEYKNLSSGKFVVSRITRWKLIIWNHFLFFKHKILFISRRVIWNLSHNWSFTYFSCELWFLRWLHCFLPLDILLLLFCFLKKDRKILLVNVYQACDKCILYSFVIWYKKLSNVHSF